MMDRNTLLDLIPAYALGALDTDEQAEVEAFLAADSEAQHLLAEYQAATEALVLATPARRAPSHLSDDLRQRLAASRPQATRSVNLDQDDTIKVLPGKRPPIWIPLVAAAAMLVLLAGALLLVQHSQQPASPAELYAQIAAQPDALRIPITPVLQASTSGDVVVSADGKEAVVRVEDLPAINADQTYQLWLVDASGAHSGGLMQFADFQGPNYIPLPLDKPVKDYVGFGVSIEPTGGSPNPNAPSGPRAFGVTISS